MTMRKIDLTSFQVATSETARQINRRIALSLIRRHEPLSRADLARRSGLQRSTVSAINEWRPAVVHSPMSGANTARRGFWIMAAAANSDIKPPRFRISIFAFRVATRTTAGAFARHCRLLSLGTRVQPRGPALVRCLDVIRLDSLEESM